MPKSTASDVIVGIGGISLQDTKEYLNQRGT